LGEVADDDGARPPGETDTTSHGSSVRAGSLTERHRWSAGRTGLQTKQVAAALGISAKTVDRHIQNAYAKLGVSTRAAVTLLALEHGLLARGELPISRRSNRL